MPGQNDNSPDPLVTASLSAYKFLRKLLAAGERFQGNFYFVADTRAENAAIVVTLSNRDKDGKRALSAGRPLRKAISGSKFARGRIRNVNNRLWMEVVAGNATPSLLGKAFKNAFTEPELAPLKKLLKQAKMGKPEDPQSPPVDAEEAARDDAEAAAIAREAIAGMDAEDLADVQDLLKENNDLGEINRALEAAFLSQEDADAEEEAERQRVLTELRTLSRDRPGDPRIQVLRYGLTEMIYKQPSALDDAFPAVGEPLSAGMVEVLQAQINNSVDELLTQLRVMAAELAVAHDSASGRHGRARALFSEDALKTLKQHPERMQNLLNQIHNMTR
jgi:hypothetical protein